MTATGNKRPEPLRQENPTAVQETYHAAGEGDLLSLIRDKSGRSRTSSKQLIASGRVSVNGTVTTQATLSLAPGDIVTVHSGVKPKDFYHPLLEKIWEDDHLLLVYKKAGLPTVNTGHKDKTETAIWILSRAMKETRGRDYKLFMLNRLDKNSEGYVLFAKTIPAKEVMVKQWGNLIRSQRFVLCLEGDLSSQSGTLSHETTDKEGKSIKRVTADYRILKRGKKGGLSIVEALVRGPRLYNLRTLVRENGLAIFGDVRSRSGYVTKDKIGLIQTGVAFLNPFSGEELSFERKFPAHFFAYLKADKGPSAGITLEKKTADKSKHPIPTPENTRPE